MDLQKLNTPKIAKLLRNITRIAAAVALVLLIIAAFAPLVRAYIPGNADPEFHYNEGQDFLGWQVTFLYWGPSIRVNDRMAFHPNALMIIAIVGTGLALIITTLLMKKGKRFRNGILDAIAAAFLIFSIIVYINACPIVLKTAGNLTAESIQHAYDNGGFTLAWYGVLLVIFLCIIAVVKLLCALYFIIFRKKPAKQEIKIEDRKEEEIQ